MKRAWYSLSLLVMMLSSISLTSGEKTKIIFFGDSITEAGAKPGGFIPLMRDALQKKGLSSQYDLVGAGVSGDRVYDLYLRMEDDVLAKNPDVVLIWIGVNDVWHKTSGTGTGPERFEKFYVALIKKLQALHIHLILATAAVIGERNDMTNPQDGDMNLYANIVKRLAKEYNTDLLDLRSDFLSYEAKNNPDNIDKGILTVDGVHLTAEGNRFVAQKMLKVLVPGQAWD